MFGFGIITTGGVSIFGLILSLSLSYLPVGCSIAWGSMLGHKFIITGVVLLKTSYF